MNQLDFRCLFVMLPLFALGNANVADGGLIVSVEDATLQPGGSTTFDVVMQTTDPDTGLRVSAVEYALTISNLANPSSLLQFTEFQGMALPTLRNTSNYIFEGINDSDPLTINSGSPQRLVFSDLTVLDSVDVSNGKLVGRFTVVGDPAASPVSGDAFTITLSDLMVFNDNFDLFAGVIELNPGTINVSVSAVPEPSSAAALMAIAGVGAWVRRRQSRRRDREIVGA